LRKMGFWLLHACITAATPNVCIALSCSFLADLP